MGDYMSNNNRYRYYKYNKNSNNKCYYYRKHNKKKKNNNILLSSDDKKIVEPVNKIFENNNRIDDELEFVPIKREKHDNLSVSKTHIFKMAFGIIILIAIVFGFSYAYFNYYKEDSRQADITGGEVYVRTIPAETVNLTLSPVYPRTNDEARSRSDNYVDFKIKAKNTSPNKVLYYMLTINNGSDVQNKVRINSQYIKVDLQEKINGNYTYIQEAVSLNNFSFNGIVPINTNSEIEREFRLRMWMSDNVLISDTDSNATFTQSEFRNLYANYHVSVNSYDGQRSSTTMSLSSNSGSITEGASTQVTITTNGDGALSCSSSTANATCSITGTTLTINGVSVGSAVITVSQASGATHLATTDVTYTATIEPSTQPSTLAVANDIVNLTYNGSSSDNTYSYNGDGTVSCNSSDNTKVTCVVDAVNNRVTVSPQGATSSGVTITVSASATANYYSPTDATFTVNVAKATSTMSLSTNSGTITEGESDTVTITTNGDGALSCTSSTAHATCSISGTTLTINGVSAGSATITVSQAQGTNYNAPSNVTYTATIESGLTAAEYILANTTLEKTPYGRVYSGANVDNYVKFNCNGTTCEQWRILGVYGDKLKIISTTRIASQKYNNSTSDGNLWGGSRLEQYLNQNTDGGYYYSLNTDAKAMIAAGSWNVGACGHDIAAAAAHTCATTTHTYSNITYTTPLANKKVGLIATYEYLYAAENDGTCWTTSGYYYDEGCKNKDWLFSTLTSSGSSNGWTLSPDSDGTNRALGVFSGGYVSNYSVVGTGGASPVVYLKSGVTITSGNGQSGNNAYTLSYSGS